MVFQPVNLLFLFSLGALIASFQPQIVAVSTAKKYTINTIYNNTICPRVKRQKGKVIHEQVNINFVETNEELKVQKYDSQ